MPHYMTGSRSPGAAQTAYEVFEKYELGFDDADVGYGPLTLQQFEFIETAINYLDMMEAPANPSEQVKDDDESSEAEGPMEQAVRQAGDDFQIGTDVEMALDPDKDLSDRAYNLYLDKPFDVEEKHNEVATKSVLAERRRGKFISTLNDIALHPYKGWKIAPPRTLIPLIKNFLADEDTDRTVNWPQKFAEICEYASYLTYNYQGEDWGPDLQEAIQMLRTHWVFETQHYGRAKLVLDFPEAKMKKNTRLVAPSSAPGIKLDASGKEPQQHLPEPAEMEPSAVWDDQYKMPKEYLRNYILPRFRTDARRFTINLRRGWEPDPREGYNSAQTENDTYERCMTGGPQETARVLESEGRWVYNPRDFSLVDGFPFVEEGALRLWATFRGAKRADMHQAFSAMDHTAMHEETRFPIFSLFETEPPKPQKEHPGIMYSSMILKNPPKDTARDPLGYARWHCWFRREQSRWAQWTREHSVKEVHGARLHHGRVEPIMDLPRNFMGPITLNLADVDMRKNLEDLRRCQLLQQGLLRYARQVPGPFAEGLVELMKSGQKGAYWADLQVTFRDDELMQGKTSEPCALRPLECDWLEFICKHGVTAEPREQSRLGPLGELLLARVRRLLDDVSPAALFSNTEPIELDLFRRGVNKFCSGPVTRHEFTWEELLKELPKLHEQRVLK